MNSSIPRIVLTLGDPLGIGAEVAVKALLKPQVRRAAVFTLVGSLQACRLVPGFERLLRCRGISFEDVGGGHFNKLTPKMAGCIAVASLERAVALIRLRECDALVTAPISKEHAALAGFGFPGHTEFLCDAFGVKRHAMMLFHSRLRVVLTTIHVPLREVSRLVTKASVHEKLVLTTAALREHFGLRVPRIAVCGLNPHAGESGLIGDEEKRVIAPAVKKFRKKFPDVPVDGPLSADGVFHKALSGGYDAVLCHYHDQGLIPLKATGFEEGVNMTLGLPFVRTSPDHGTAFDIAGKGVANPRSMVSAILAAKAFCRAKG